MNSTVRIQKIKPLHPSDDENACLVYIYPPGPLLGKRFSLGLEPIVIGRDPGCPVCVADASVSRRHVEIVRKEDGFYARDLQSTNGTYINDMPVVDGLLNDGDYLRIGSCIFRFLSSTNVEADYHKVIYQLTIIDPLTEIHNKRFLMEFLDRELARCGRHHRPLSLILFDLDFFKKVNDQYGHLGGDYTLKELVSRIKVTVRRDELFARYGGEEFVIVMPETTLEGAVQVADRIRQLIAQEPFHYEDEVFHVTISLGIATTLGEEMVSPYQILQAADEKLYEAKKSGRNCLMV